MPLAYIHGSFASPLAPCSLRSKLVILYSSIQPITPKSQSKAVILVRKRPNHNTLCVFLSFFFFVLERLCVLCLSLLIQCQMPSSSSPSSAMTRSGNFVVQSWYIQQRERQNRLLGIVRQWWIASTMLVFVAGRGRVWRGW